MFYYSAGKRNNGTSIREIIVASEVDESPYLVPMDEKVAKSLLAQYAKEDAEPTAEEDMESMLVDHEYRLVMLELGLTE